ncbi:PH domain-containing protein [Macrococcus bovicus]|uniref:PH domain-containing protein n=1 Tax=Macrococcus bovicus TaxID=69968 RepID=UPI0025A56B05|nr:PH domain-containing protein [Macrococcus bovicus]WJP97316.1 PH domain-containing protein [Macrococcus bovicus]
MKKKKMTIRQALEQLDYPLTYKKFSKTFKKIKKNERRFFIKLLKVYCSEIKNHELVYLASASQLNLNQKGLVIVLADRLMLIHSKERAKIIHFDEIEFNKIAQVDFERMDESDNDIYGSLFLKVARKNMGTKNYNVRGILKEDLPKLTEFIKMKKS